MTLKTKLRYKFGISDEQLKLAKPYIQGLVYAWVKNRKGEVFTLRDLVGGENFDWNGENPLVLPLRKTHYGR